MLETQRFDYSTQDEGSKWIAFLYPLSIVLRRLIFSFVVVLKPDFVWLHLSTIIFTQQAIWMYLAYYKPFLGVFQNQFELMSEVYTSLLMCHLFLFTDFVPNPETRHDIGYLYTFLFASFIVLQVLLLSGKTLIKLIIYLRRCYLLRKRSKFISFKRFNAQR